MDRCALFVDAGYALGDGALAVHGTGNRDSVSWDYAGVLRLLSGLCRERTGLPLLRCYWYDLAGPSGREDEHDALADLPGVKLRLSSPRPGSRDGAVAEMRKDLITLARNKAVADVVIVTAADDIAPVVAEVQEYGLRALLLTYGTEDRAASRGVLQEFDEVLEMSAAHLVPFVDLIAGAEPSTEITFSRAVAIEAPPPAPAPPADPRPQSQPAAAYAEAAPVPPAPAVIVPPAPAGPPGGPATPAPAVVVPPAPAGPPAAPAPEVVVPRMAAQPPAAPAPVPPAAQPGSLPQRQPAADYRPPADYQPAADYRPLAEPPAATAAPVQAVADYQPAADYRPYADPAPAPAAQPESLPQRQPAADYPPAAEPPAPVPPAAAVSGEPLPRRHRAPQYHPADPAPPARPSAAPAGFHAFSPPGDAQTGNGHASVPANGSAASGSAANGHSANGTSTHAPGAGPGVLGAPAGQNHARGSREYGFAPGQPPFESQQAASRPANGQHRAPGSHRGPAPEIADAMASAHAEGFEFGEGVAEDAPALWLEAVLARKPRMPSDLEAKLLQGSALPIDSLLHDEVRHALRRGFWDALERSRH